MYQQQQPYNPYAGLFGIIGTIMGMNAAKRNEAGIASALGSIGDQPQQPIQQQPQQAIMERPTNAPLPVNSQNVAQRMGLVQGLLPQQPQTPTLDTPQVQPRTIPAQTQMTQPQGLDAPVMPEQAPAPVTAAPATPAAPAAPVETPKTATMQAPNKMKTQQDLQQWGKSTIVELTKNRGLSYNEAKDKVNKVIQEESDLRFNKAADEYAGNLNLMLDEVSAMDLSSAAAKSQFLGTISKVDRGLKSIGRQGVDMGIVKEMLKNGDINVKQLDLGDGVQFVAINSDGSKITPLGSKFAKQVSPDTIYRSQAAIAAAQARGPRGGGGGVTDSKKADMFKWASTPVLKPTGEMDIMGKPIMTREPNDAALAARLAAELGFGPAQPAAGGQQGPAQTAVPVVQQKQTTGDSNLDAKVEIMRQRNAPQQLIDAMIQEEKSKPYTGETYLGF